MCRDNPCYTSMMHLRASLLATTLLALSLFAAVPVRAQSFAERSSAGRDSLATRVAYTAVLGEMTSFLARRLYDTAPAPWDMQFPDDSRGVLWSDIRRALTTLLRARPVTDADSTRAHLRVRHVLRSTDSLIVVYDLGAYRRCPNGTDWEGSHSTRRLEVAWARLAEPYRHRVMSNGDMLGCGSKLERRP